MAARRASKPDLLLHPIRMRIVIALAGQRLTAQQIIERLPDVSQATLYRHLNLLAKQDILKVVEERPVRGTVEKVYMVTDQVAALSAEEFAHLSPDEKLHSFMIFLVSLIDEFQRYIASSPTDLMADGFGYRVTPFFLTDEELKNAANALNAALLPYFENTPRADRRRRLFATIVIPESGGDSGKTEDTTTHD